MHSASQNNNLRYLFLFLYPFVFYAGTDQLFLSSLELQDLKILSPHSDSHYPHGTHHMDETEHESELDIENEAETLEHNKRR
jgi:hypothetical protein